MSAAPDETSARIRDLFATYQRTHYRVVLPDHAGSTIQIDAPAPGPIIDWIGRDDFAAYMTSCNPYSQELTDRQNDERLADLRERLYTAGARFLEGIASAPNESWFEPSLLVTSIPLTAVDAFARMYEQNAIVVVPARGIARLRVYRAAWHPTLIDSPDVEWSSPETAA